MNGNTAKNIEFQADNTVAVKNDKYPDPKSGISRILPGH